ncbi:hypothetical protein Lesp02_37160 [Lentzea sp. NBRC 105346]|uniref:hypothetical protein n=1 Tax=Lentzea sp. NBRC 105346 TaxID=3032205 RepID=UPI0024A11005|nr:hypothetical protein [Lentzea sp. NBRC 105346]GLZ31528.1 hypothetical protein Lesp02_37160 [Lentzea sp. NBRC 105346]
MRTRLGAAIAAVGLITGVTGTFLPWLRSGSIHRDSYEVLSLRDFAGLNTGPGEVVTLIWVGITPLAVCALALWVVRFRRFAACIGLLFGTITGTVAALAVVQGGDTGSLIGISLSGPVVTLSGAVLAIVGAITVLTAKTRSAMSTPGGGP